MLASLLHLDDGEGNADESHPINEHHPEVKIAVKAAEDRVRRSPPESTPNMYMDALTIAVADAEQRRKNQHDGRRYIHIHNNVCYIYMYMQLLLCQSIHTCKKIILYFLSVCTST